MLTTEDDPSRGTPERFHAAAEASPVPNGETRPRGAGRDGDAANAKHPLFAPDQAAALRWRWESIQEGFVDGPRAAVAEADALIVEVVARLNEVCTDKRAELGGQWGASIGASTEDLRMTLQRYRQLLERLLSL